MSKEGSTAHNVCQRLESGGHQSEHGLPGACRSGQSTSRSRHLASLAMPEDQATVEPRSRADARRGRLGQTACARLVITSRPHPLTCPGPSGHECVSLDLHVLGFLPLTVLSVTLRILRWPPPIPAYSSSDAAAVAEEVGNQGHRVGVCEGNPFRMRSLKACRRPAHCITCHLTPRTTGRLPRGPGLRRPGPCLTVANGLPPSIETESTQPNLHFTPSGFSHLDKHSSSSL